MENKKYKEDRFFAVVDTGSASPTLLVANIGKAFACHTERRKTKREKRVIAKLNRCVTVVDGGGGGGWQFQPQSNY